MNEFENIDLFDEIDEKHIASAEKAGKAKRAARLFLPIAAGLCLVMGIGLILGKGLGNKHQGAHEITALATETAVNTQTATDVPLTPEPTEAPADEADKLYLTYVGAMHEAGTDDYEAIPWGIDYYMFIYNGKEYFMFSYLDPLCDVIGEKLGTVEKFDFQYSAHWFSDCVEENAGTDTEHPPYILLSENELKGTVEGNIYSVKGFGPDEMICMRLDYFNNILLFTADNGITDNYGAAFFEDVLHMSDNITELRYYSHTDISPRDGANGYAIGADTNEVGLLLEAINEASWVEDTRTWNSRYFNESETMALQEDPATNGYSIALDLGGSMDVQIVVYRDGIITIGSSFRDMALSAEVSKLQPLFDLMDVNGGRSLKVSTQKDKLEKCKADPRFGEMVPSWYPNNLRVTATYIEYVTDSETGAIIDTDHIRIDYKDKNHDSIIYLWIMPIERKDTDYSIKCAVKAGATIVDLNDFDTSCMCIRKSGHEEDPNDLYSQSVVTYKDAVIYVEAFGTLPSTVVRLLGSILDR
ncbi:MAG: hypothetical protein J5772_05270 [Clostridia bacterium]|nr:hypothetical protein [Clostridia bacterium]